jgi:sugar lactone lactonase YvrE
MYIADFGAGKVTEISTNGTQSIFATGVPDAFDLTFDRAGNLYVSDGPDQTVTEIMTNGTKSTFATGLSDPIGLAFDGSGNLFVVCELVEQIIEINSEGVTNHFASVVGNYAKFDAAGNLFMTGSGSGEVLEFAPNGSQRVFASGLNQPMGLAFQPVPQLQGCATNDAFQLTVTMPSPYYSTTVQVSTDLVNWSDVYTNLPPFVFTDSTAAISPNRFYRAVLAQ